MNANDFIGYEDFATALGAAIRYQRAHKGVSQTMVARKASAYLDRHHLSRLENGLIKQPVFHKTIFPICTALNIPDAFVMELERLYKNGEPTNKNGLLNPRSDHYLGHDWVSGTWLFTGVEFGHAVRLAWHIDKNYTTDYDATCDGIRVPVGINPYTYDSGSGLIYENFSDGKIGRALVNKIDDDLFELTIVDNDVARYRGIKRRYQRLPTVI